MTNGDNHRRSYGYTNKKEPGGQGKYETKLLQKKAVRQEPVTEQRPFNWIRLFLFPFRILGMLIFRIFQLLGWILKKIPWNLPFRKGNIGITFKIMFVLCIVAFISITGIFVWASKDLPDPNRLTDRQVAQSTKIYDRTGEHILYEVFADKKRTLITLDELPKDLINGVISTEDTTFYEHRGIRPLSLLRSIMFGLIGQGRFGGGASTLTQQLVKNAILTNERRLSRKVKEIILSIRLEQVYTKDQILQIYFNEIPYGSTNYGIESAAQSYFGKSASELTLAESATLAGMPKQPSAYIANTALLKERRNFVLRRMAEERYITEEQKISAQQEPLGFSTTYSNINAPHFVLYVKQKLVEQYGEQTVDTGGLKVITSLDWKKQQIAEKVVEEIGTDALESAGANNTALVSLDPKTGQILAMIGSKDFYDNSIQGQFNVATLAKRQPGSSFKPIIYAAAFEKGYTPNTILFDVITDFGKNSGRSYKPLNYDLSEHGPVTIRQALQGSLNIPAVKALYLVGDKKGVDFAERLGYSTLGADNFGLSLVLGGGEVTLLDHVSAYATFANGGIRHEPVSILKIEDSRGDVLFEWKQSKGIRVLEKNITDTMSNILSDDASRAYVFGAGGILTLKDRPVATKTGTTNNYVDAWTIGYTPSLVAGVWAGNTNNTPMKRGYGGSKVAAPIWNAFMIRALQESPIEHFDPLPNFDTDKAVLNGTTGGGITLKVDKITGRIATSSTPEEYIEERTYVQAHSILHYVNTDDPRGALPEHPELNPQYQIWEDAIQDWIKRKKEKDPTWNMNFGDPPTEYDDLHSLELIPTLNIIYPVSGSTIYSRQIDTDIRVSAPRGVTKVTYRLDTVFVGVIRNHPFNLNYYAQWLEPGEHTLTVIVEDDVGNRIEETITFTLSTEVEEEVPSVTWVEKNIHLSQEDFPRTFFLNPFKIKEIKTLQIIATKDTQNFPITTITDFSDLFNNQITITWNSVPEKGVWTLTATTISATSQNIDSLSVTVN